MLVLLFVSGLLALRAAAASPETRRPEERPLEWASVLNESCREQVLQRAGASILRLLNMDRPPLFTPEAARQLREARAKELAGHVPLPSELEPPVDVSSNQTLLIRRGGCIQASHYITMEELGWENWVLLPKALVLTECLGCPCPGKEEGSPLQIHGCLLGGPRSPPESETKQKRRCCCRPRHAPLRFMLLGERGSLTVRAAPMVHACFGRH